MSSELVANIVKIPDWVWKVLSSFERRAEPFMEVEIADALNAAAKSQGNLNDEDLNRTIEFSLGNGPKYTMRFGELMQHGAIHGIHHRGQVALLLRALGQPPSNFDILFYYGRDQAR